MHYELIELGKESLFRLKLTNNLTPNNHFHRYTLVSIFSLIGCVLLFGFAVNTLFRGLYLLSLIEFSISAFLLASYLFTHYYPSQRLYNINRHITLITFLSFGLFLVQSGGVENTGLLWIFIIPPVIFAFCGLSIGVIYNTLFISIVTILLFYPNDSLLDTHYSYDVSSRFVYAYIASFLLFAAYEAARQQSHDDLQKMKNKFEKESNQDELTQLSNRRHMWEILNRQQFKKNRQFVIALLDLDYFKKVNDNFGHDVGDDVLKNFSLIVKNSLRQGDHLARWGGEEFLLLLPDTDSHDALIVLDKIKNKVLSTPFITNKLRITISVSIGFCPVSADSDLNTAMTSADQALYQAKSNGRNRVVSYI